MMIDSPAFQLSRNIMADARGLGLNYFETLEEEMSKIDCGIRAGMKDSQLHFMMSLR